MTKWQIHTLTFCRQGIESYDHVCLGALVTENHVVSAGHCFKDKTLYIEEAEQHPERFAIMPLTLNKVNKEPSESSTLIQVSTIIVHPGFQNTPSATFKDDVAVVILKDKSSRQKT